MRKFALPIACFSMLMFAACGNDDENGNRPNGLDEMREPLFSKGLFRQF